MRRLKVFTLIKLYIRLRLCLTELIFFIAGDTDVSLKLISMDTYAGTAVLFISVSDNPRKAEPWMGSAGREPQLVGWVR